MAKAARAVPEGFQSITPQLTLDNAAEAIEWYKRAIAAGTTEQMPMGDQFWGDRAGSIADPAGYSWWIATRKEDLTQDELRQRADEFFKQMAAGAPTS